jgi:hypothetical protein
VIFSSNIIKTPMFSRESKKRERKRRDRANKREEEKEKL